MTVKTQLVVSLLITATAIAFAGRSARPESLGTIDTPRAVAVSDRTADSIGAAHSDRRPTALKRRLLTPVASVTSRLDLTKLTLADFGDVESAR